MANRFLNNITINDEYTLPAADGTADQIITTDGAGQLSFVDPSTIIAGTAEKVVIYAKNTHTAQIAKGTPVYITGTVGATDTVQIAPADASNSAKMPAVGILDATLAVNAFGYVITGGFMDNITTDPIDGATPSSNDTVYVKAGGGLTLTKPTTAANLIQNIAKVGKVSGGSAGSLIVSSILRTNDVPNLNTGKIWVGQGNTIESSIVFLDEPNGRMGIGTTSPNEKLHTAGNIHAYDASGINAALFASTAAGSTTIAIRSSGITHFNGGNVGIGTTNPGAKLEISSTDNVAAIINSTSAFTFLDFENDGANRVQVGNASDGDFIIRTSDAERLRVDSNGNVGIGTANPSAKLHVVDTGSTSVTHYLKFNNEDSAYGGLTIGSTGADLKIRQNAGYGYFDATGFSFNYDTGRVWMNNGSILDVRNSSNSTVFYIPTSGNVGIGTTSPSEKLHVDGNIRVTGAYYDSSNSAGTSGQVLSSTATGTSWVSGSGLPGGPYLPLAGGTMTGNTLHGDNVKSTYGNVGDLEIYHDGSNSYISDVGTGDLIIRSGNDLRLQSAIGNEAYITCNENASVEVYYDNAKKLETTSTGVNITGEVRVTGAYYDSSNSAGTSGQVLSSTGSGTAWIAAGGGGASSLNDLSDVEIGLGSAAFINIPSGGIGSGTLIIGSGAGNSMTSGATNNIAIGLNAGASITSSDEHTIIGSGAGRYVVPGTGGNTLVGYNTGLGVSGSSTYTYTTAVGVDCLEALTTGSRNTVVGSQSGINITTGSSNIVMGNLSGSGLITRSYAVVIGYQAMQFADSGSTVAIGYQANNTASTSFGTGAVHIGYQAGRSSTRNRAVNIGYGAGYSATSGGGVVIGEFASYSNTSGSNRVVIGAQAARFFTGSDATAIGAYALYSSGSGYGNTGVGANALRDNSSGSRNTAIGHDAGENITTGSNNTTLGANAGDALLTGSNNTIIGYTSAASSTSVSNEITLGNTSITSLRCNVTSITSLSDKRDKKNIEESSYGLNVIDKLKPVTFDWDARDGSKTDIKDLGFIAQDLQGIDDEHLKLVYAENPEKLEATYGRLIPVLVKAIQELKAEIELLKS